MTVLKWIMLYIQHEILVLPSRVIAVVFCIFLLSLPLFTQNVYILRVLALAGIFAIFAAGWDLLSGFTGQLSLGHALFFGVSAYVAGLLNLHLGLPPLITIPLGASAAVLAGMLVGIPCLRLKGPYLGIATLAFPIMLTGIIFLFSKYTGGELGLYGIVRLAETRLQEYYIITVLMLILCFAMWKITDSKIGLIFHAIREDEIAARAVGVNTIKYKLLAFGLSGFVAGVAGGMFVHFMRVSGPFVFAVFMSFQAIILSIFGGIASIYGAIAGAYLLLPVSEFLRGAQELRMIVYGLIVLLVLRFMPEGVVNWVRDRMEKECPRCKARNAVSRKVCRVCFSSIRQESLSKTGEGF